MMTQIWLVVDWDGWEVVYEDKPWRHVDTVSHKWMGGGHIYLPEGTIEKILGRKLTWDDEPVIVEETLGQERALGGDTGTSRAEDTIYLGDGVYFSPELCRAKLFISDGIFGTDAIYLDQHVALALILALQNWVRGEGR